MNNVKLFRGFRENGTVFASMNNGYAMKFRLKEKGERKI
jgi:hypothetical protein